MEKSQDVEGGRDELLGMLDEGLRDLGAAEREALVRRYLQEQSLKEVGAALGVSDAHLSARALAGRIKKGEVKDKFALRDLYRNGWTLLCNREEALAACDVLASLHWFHE